MSQNTIYLITAIALAGVITFLLRVLPFAVLKKLRGSKYVKKLGLWMPVGIMLILAVSTTFDAFTSRSEVWWTTPAALAVTIVTHIVTKRNTALSVLIGTLTYVILVNI